MIREWKVDWVSRDDGKQGAVVYINGGKDAVDIVVRTFRDLCEDPFEIKEGEFNLAFNVKSSDRSDISKIEELLKRMKQDSDGVESDEELKSLVNEVKKVIQDLDKKGLTVEELKSFEEKKAARDVVEEVKEGIKAKIPKEEEQEQDVLDTMTIGFLFPEKNNKKFEIFMDTFSSIEKITSKDPLKLKKVFKEPYNPFDKQFKMDSVQNLFKGHNMEGLVLLAPDARMVPKEKEIVEELKKRLKKKLLFKVVPVPRIGKRSVYLDLIVDIALFKGKGIEYFKLKK
ncbi:MAG: hypothetical protein ABH868_00480 [bacterium]